MLPDGKLRVKGEDANLGKLVAADVDMVVLASAIEPQPDASQVATLFGLSRTSDGWFAEAHPKLRPVETNTDGVFLAGCAQGPKDVPDTVAHAGAAASMVLALLNRGEVTISPADRHRERGAVLRLQDLPLALPVHGDQLHRRRQRGARQRGAVQGLRHLRRGLPGGRDHRPALHR